MSAAGDEDIPRLTDIVSESELIEKSPSGFSELDPDDREALIAELQTRLAASTFDLTDKLMRDAFAEMEAKIYKQISSSLRQELPELIDTIIREQVGKDQEED